MAIFTISQGSCSRGKNVAGKLGKALIEVFFCFFHLSSNANTSCNPSGCRRYPS